MGHNIHIRADGTAAAMYANKPAWHGLGEVVQGARKWAEVLKRVRFITVESAQAYQKVGNRYVEIPNFRFVRNAARTGETKDVFAAVSPDYEPIQYEEMGRVLDELVGRKAAAYVSAFMLGKGERAAAVLELSAVKGLKLPGDQSRYGGYLVATTSHDGTAALHVGRSMVRLECQNMLNGWLEGQREQIVTIRHTGDTAGAVKAAAETLRLVEQTVQDFTETAVALQDVKLKRPTVDELIADLIPISEDMTRAFVRMGARETIGQLYDGSKTLVGVKPSGYRFMQAVAEYAQHYHPLRISAETAEREGTAAIAQKRFRSATEGQALKLQQDAMALMRERYLSPALARAKAIANN